MELRKYQERGIDEIRALFRSGKRRVCYVAPCGSGKTVLMTYMANRTAAHQKRVLFVVHRRELIDQASKTLTTADVAHGILAPGYAQTSDLIQVGSVQALSRREIPPPDLLIFDECHHAMAKTWKNIMDRFPSALVVGLTATPERMGGQGLGDLFQSMVIGPTAKELIAMGNLAPYRYYAPPVVADLEGMRVKCGDFVQGEAAARMDKPTIIGDAVQHYQRLAPGMQAIVYCASIDHSRHTAAAFTEAGIPAEHVDGTTLLSEREAIMGRFRRGETKIMTNVDLFGEGLDVPAMECVILLRPTASLTLYIQQSMRPMRPKDGKTAIILDHVGNYQRHGLPDAPRVWSLEGKAKRKKEKGTVAIRQCPLCYATHEPAPTCPYCGYAYPIATKELEVEEGNLVEIDLNAEYPAGSMAALEQVRIQRGYKPGWVSRQAKSIADLEEIARIRHYKKTWAFLTAKRSGIAI